VRANIWSLPLVLAVSANVAGSQATAARAPARGWEFVGLPALNFATDEGIGYGALLEAYNYGSGIQPYRFTIQPTVFLTTKGRRDISIFFDAPKLLPEHWRLDAVFAREEHLATPYYGIGNGSAFVEQNEAPPNAYFYRYGRRALRVATNLQRTIGSSPARFLLGAGFASVSTDATPFDSGTTLFATDFGGSQPTGRINFVRAGLIWDTRDREIGPQSGTWSELLVQRVDEAMGATSSYTRVTATGRRYFPLTSRLIFAQRVLAQQTDGVVPVFDLATVQSSFKQQEGLGGGNTVRGLPKNRYMGKGLVVSNSELRWRASDFDLLGKPIHLVVSGFVDAGRVWSGAIRLDELAAELHAGYGGGLRVGVGPSFIAAFDLGRSSESTQIYIGLGYPF
jgi:hypothetical protein